MIKTNPLSVKDIEAIARRVRRDYLDKDTPAVYNAIDNFIYLKESVINEIENGNYRSNFTLAHELFHYLQNKILGFNFEEVDERKTYEDPEWQANCFAGELLLPDEYLNNEDNDYLANHFQVSIECVPTRKVKNKKRYYNNKFKKGDYEYAKWIQ